MKSIGIRTALLIAASAAAIICTSCDRKTSVATAPGAVPGQKGGPEESLKYIMETFHRRVVETPVGFVVSQGSSRSTLTGNYDTSYEVIRPASPGDPYKAIVTVKSEANYSLMHTSKDNQGDNADDQNKKKDDSGSSFGNDKKVGDVFDSGVPSVKASAEGGKSHSGTHAGEEAVARRQGEAEKKYELQYVDGRWKLVSELSKDNEQSIQNAFHDALATQD